tara:strand:+ start:232 stop:996 length:765 start_codon:yes stop_codon:yes gene_type:complete
MEPFVDQIWRFPIKSLGSEAVKKTTLQKNKTIVGDRIWALTYENSRFDIKRPTWYPCQVFLRCSIAPLFAAVGTQRDDSDDTITFTHPKLKSIRLNLEDATHRKQFVEWVAPICPENAPKPSALCRVPDRGMTDTDYPSVSLNSLSSLRDLSKRVNSELNPKRFRGNIWIEGLEPWSELSLIGQEVRIGQVRLKVIEPIVRCNTTKTNEITGVRDVDTLSTLEKSFGHKNFGVYCKVLCNGDIGIDDPFEVLKL